MGAQGSGKGRSALRAFLGNEAAGGLLLMGAAAFAMIVANSPFGTLYENILHMPLGPELTPKLGPMTPHLWISDGLMAIFFLLVGLEIKREFVDGRLATWEYRRLPVIAAASGMAVPALLYLTVIGGDPLLRNGWAIPAATDIAFAIGVLALLGNRAPTSLKLFLTTVAIVDDMGAVAIIAIAYTASLDLAALGVAAGIMLVMYIMGKSGVTRLWIFAIGAFCLWYAVLLSGVHATIAGILAAMTIPIVGTPDAPDSALSPLHRLEKAIAPLVAVLIVPLFGFANAGVSLEGLGLDRIFAPLPLGIAAGLFLGKQAGIFGAVWLSVRLGFARNLRGATWPQIYGISTLCGIGFTMSLVIGGLAFPLAPDLVEKAKIGILLGSLVSAIVGYAVLRFVPLHRRHFEEEALLAREIIADGDVERVEEKR
ncbi:Na+/H+ antiporter NhaA [Sphingosinicella rhizophila]|uniref:Na(+)/H(+) antiporter NhaA n=1 Tax=Sphingosinicella rhizophila TaxID=3050082 RepID=A0ABU3Q8F0_9SPHN|nr:Na+/H+ antiporter NhaA [Sphingosinicella sp. GR2756]MDT9599679.1 Na+/H+ antiporter NhaA [Sphingosinicella sp. GR2756]